MTTTPARPRAERLRRADVGSVMTLLERDFGRLPQGLWDPRHHYLLDALDRGEHDRFVVYPAASPVAVVHLGASGTVVPAGDPDAATALAAQVDRSHWRILIGDEPIARALVDATVGRAWWRRKATVRVQRLLTADDDSVTGLAVPDGFRRAWRGDLDRLTDFACRLHVEDRMGPPLHGAARQGVRQRMTESVDRGMTWVVERNGAAVAKVDLSLFSRRRGAQIAGVFVDDDWRSRGVGGAMVAALTRELLGLGLPVVSLHVRDDNRPGITAYERAGFLQRGRWLLALR